MIVAIDPARLCGCCEGVAVLTPDHPFNRPGLNALRYRVGTHGSFLASMLARLASHELGAGDDPSTPPTRPLAGLNVRDADDPAIALLDAWATVADVLTFYQERIANEGYLRTATERRSLLELARLIGYRPRPGVSASTYLAFTIDKTFVLDRAATAVQDFNGKESVVAIPRGSRAASVPGPDERPQTFETADEIEARASWSILRPRLSRPSEITRDQYVDLTAGLHFAGTTTGLKPNDRLVLDSDPRAASRVLRVESVTPDVDRNRTRVMFQDPDRTRERTWVIVAAFREAMDFHGAAPIAANGVVAPGIKTRLLDPPLPQNGRPGAVVAELDRRIAALEAELAVAEANGWGNIADWLQQILQDIFATAAFVRSLDGMAPVAAAATGDEPDRGDVSETLQQPPSVPPPSARDLARDPATLYGPDSDLILRLSTGGDPALARRLADALAQFDESPDPILTVRAMRVVGAPFGATAPKRPVFDSRGGVIGEEEWPLAEETVRLKITGGFGTWMTDVDLTGGQISGSATIELTPNLQHVPVGDLPIFLTTSGELWHAIFEVESGDELVTIDIDETNGGEQEAEFHVVIDGQSRFIRPDAPVRATVGALRVMLDLTLADQAGTRVLTIAYTKPVAVTNPVPGESVLALDAQYDQIVPGGLVVIERPDAVDRVLTVLSARTVGQSAYNTAGKVTRLELNGDWLEADDASLGDVRDVTVYAHGEAVQLAGDPIEDDVALSQVDVDTLISGMEPGRWLIVSGERTDIPRTSGVMAAELVMLAAVEQTRPGQGERPGEPIVSILRFARPLSYSYKRESVRIWANVAKATHGETLTEIIGSGAAHQAFQTFPLSQKPLTYLPAVNPIGAESTLQLFVDGIRWTERTEMLELGPTDRGYITSTNDDDRTAIIGGNGRTGARFPTGSANISATYRYGVGKAGNVRAEQISQLQSRPLGVQSVINPLPATGGADRDSVAQIRRNAPLAVLALDRLVSVQDYEDFARGRAGIGKASASLLSDGARTVVHLTIAGADDVPITPASDLYRALVSSLREFGDPAVPVVVATRELLLMIVIAHIRIAPDRRWDVVEPRIRQTLLDRYGFERQELGQSVLASDVIATIQATPGVVYVDLDVLWGEPEDSPLERLENLSGILQRQPPPDQWIEASLAIEVAAPTPNANSGIRPARLILLSPLLPDTLILEEIAP